MRVLRRELEYSVNETSDLSVDYVSDDAAHRDLLEQKQGFHFVELVWSLFAAVEQG